MSRPRPTAAWIPLVESRRCADSEGTPCLEVREVEAPGRTASGPSIFLYPGDTYTFSYDALPSREGPRLVRRARPPTKGGLS